MKIAWHGGGSRPVEHVEIVDKKRDCDLYETWKPFIPHHHYRTLSSFDESWIAGYPRRSSEALWAASIEARPTERLPIPDRLSFDEMYEWLAPIAQHEKAFDGTA
jgi:hypothetical protein